MSTRNGYLDFLRALAILMVLVFHTAQMWPVSRPWLLQYTQYGARGVDLFFVLSGWLIGGLFWRELRDNGKVDLPYFWMRRLLRTVPPYLVALLLSWVAVFWFRREPFDIGYLLFVQNYYTEIPFFLISWSLCIEEHFYLFLPLFLVGLGLFTRRYLPVMSALGLLPMLLRLIEADDFTNRFGYYVTATHLNADGLLAGFTAAWVWTRRRDGWRGFALGLQLVWPLVIVRWLLEPDIQTAYVVDRWLVAMGFLAALSWFVARPDHALFSNRPVRWIAVTSYSLYLTHALMLHVGEKLVYGRFVNSEIGFLVAILLLVFGAGSLFYLLIERSAFRLRAVWTRRRMNRQVAHAC